MFNRGNRITPITKKVIPVLEPKLVVVRATDGTDQEEKKDCEMTIIDSAVCPECGVELIRYGACFSCPVCGLGSCG